MGVQLITKTKTWALDIEVGRGTCVWALDRDEESWDTTCGEKFQFFDAGPVKNGMKFCCYCGATLKEESAAVRLRRLG